MDAKSHSFGSRVCYTSAPMWHSKVGNRVHVHRGMCPSLCTGQGLPTESSHLIQCCLCCLWLETHDIVCVCSVCAGVEHRASAVSNMLSTAELSEPQLWTPWQFWTENLSYALHSYWLSQVTEPVLAWKLTGLRNTSWMLFWIMATCILSFILDFRF